MKLASLDVSLASSHVEALNFLAPAGLGNYDAVLWSPRTFLGHLGTRIERRNPDVLSATASDELLRISRHWRHEFERLLKRDGTLVILAEPESTVGIHTLQEIMPYDSLEPLAQMLQVRPAPYPAPQALPCSHTGEPFRSLFEDLAGLIQPTVTLQQWPGIPALFDAVGRPLAAYVSVVPGRVLWLPSLDSPALQAPAGADRLVHALGRCLDRLGFMAGVSYAPWLSRYVTPQEGRSLQARRQLLQERAALDDKIRECDAVIGEIEFYKQVVGGGGRSARLAVAESFRRNGYVVQHDWLNEQIIIIEDDTHWVAAYVLFDGDDTGPAVWEQVNDAAARVRTYFNRPTLAVLIDCTQNNKPFNQRTMPGPLTLQSRANAVPVVESPALYGWLDTREPLSLVVEQTAQGDSLRQQLYQRGVHALQTPAPGAD